jgi:RNA polymerase sigma-70 factor (ECF subfamily)
MSQDPSNPGSAARFASTRWSLVLAAGERASPDAHEALEVLCRTYWYPLYAFARRLGYSAADAQDLTQAFFTRLLEKDYLQEADRQRGKFRSFLLACFQHFVSKERQRARAQKRGGGRTALPLDFETAESRYNLEPSHDRTAERIYERRWALTLLDQALARLRQEFVDAGKDKVFAQLKGFLTGEAVPYRQVGAELDMTEGAVKVAVHRLRRRFRELLLAEVGQTVARPDDVDDELRHLFTAVRSGK